MVFLRGAQAPGGTDDEEGRRPQADQVPSAGARAMSHSSEPKYVYRIVPSSASPGDRHRGADTSRSSAPFGTATTPRRTRAPRSSASRRSGAERTRRASATGTGSTRHSCVRGQPRRRSLRSRRRGEQCGGSSAPSRGSSPEHRAEPSASRGLSSRRCRATTRTTGRRVGDGGGRGDAHPVDDMTSEDQASLFAPPYFRIPGHPPPPRRRDGHLRVRITLPQLGESSLAGRCLLPSPRRERHGGLVRRGRADGGCGGAPDFACAARPGLVLVSCCACGCPPRGGRARGGGGSRERVDCRGLVTMGRRCAEGASGRAGGVEEVKISPLTGRSA